ncbi:MAG: chitobiase/beta-hexosaminidase C-terminal domain-containing protein [Fibrobacterota bacterium]|nr:MAG: chitobiase/beta-hexosaminidase C-terminal domain-containing protein [Fibrobacterota bacterium]
MDYASARQLVAALSVDSSSLNPFQLETALRLDTLRPGEPPVGLLGKIKGKKGVKSIEYVIENDSGLRTDRFVLADFPDLNANPATVDLAGHPTFAPRANAVQGAYTLRLLVKDALGNEQVYATAFHVGAELDHKGPSLIVLSPTSAVVRDFNDSQLVVKVEAKDPSGVKSVTIDGKVADKGEDGIWFDTLVVPVRDSSQLVKIEAKDVFGNASDAQIQIRRNQKPIPTAPRLKLVSPASGTLVAFEDSVVRVVWKAETDFGKIDSVTIDGVQAKAENGTWVRELILPANGKTTSFGVRAYSSVPLTATEYVSIGRKADNAGPVVVWSDAAKSQRITYDVKQTEISVTASDLSGVDSVRIGGSKVNPLNKEWKATVLLAGPGELTRILVEAWDHAGNRTDTELVVARDPIPTNLPPEYRWLKPDQASGTVIPFAEAKYLVQCVLTDISGIDSASVMIGGVLAKPINDTVWERWVDLPPDGKAQVITLEAKNKRGISVPGFVLVTRSKDEEKPTSTRLAGTKDLSVMFDSTSVEVGWSAKDNDRIAQVWIQDSLVPSDASGYHRRVPLAITTQWVKFRAVDPAGNEVRDSVQIERHPDTVKAVTLSDTNGKLRSGTFWVKLSCVTPGATIRYTLNGSDPTATSPIYADSIKIGTTITLKARGFAKDRVDGPSVTQGYQMAVPVAVSSASNSTLVLMSDHSLWAMGGNWRHHISADTSTFILRPVKIADSVAQMSVGSRYSLWVKLDGTLWGIGESAQGAFGDGFVTSLYASPTLIMRGVKKAIATNTDNTYVLKTDGTLWGAGSNVSFQLALGWKSEYETSLQKIASRVRDMGAGNYVMYFVDEFSELFFVGERSDFKDSIPYSFGQDIALLPENAANGFLLGAENGAVVGYGWVGKSAKYGMEKLQFDWENHPILTEQVGVVQISSGWAQTIFRSKAGDVYVSGANADWQLGKMLPSSVGEVTKIPFLASYVAAGTHNSYIVTKSGELFGSGKNRDGQLGLGFVSEKEDFTRIRF